MTTIVEEKTSIHVGQVTFFSSAFTSTKKFHNLRTKHSPRFRGVW